MAFHELKICFFSTSGSFKAKAKGIVIKPTNTCAYKGCRKEIAAKNPPKTPAAASEKFPIEILLPSYFKNLFSFFIKFLIASVICISLP